MTEFEKATLATIYFDVDKFGLSMIKNFPDFTVSLGDFGIVGTGIFEEDTLAQVGDLEARINLRDVLFGDKVSVKGVHLDDAQILIMVLENGQANYDIARPSDTAEPIPEDGESGSVDFGINSFSIANSDFIYFDQSSGVITQLTDMDLKGSGDFASEVFDLTAVGEIADTRFIYQGAEYAANKHLELDLTLSIDLPNSTYRFKENQFLINAFPLSLNGDFTMLEEGYKMNIGFSSPSTDFKKLFSLIPGAYTESFDDVEAEGKIAFRGAVKGTYSENQMPGFNIELNVEDGMVHYPGLPESMTNIQVELKVDNPNGVIEETLVNLDKMHVDLGKNPFDASLKVLNLKDYPIESKVNGSLNLADVTKMLPIEDMKLDGLLKINATAEGRYDSVNNIIPKLNVQVELDNGLIQLPDLPSPITDVKLNTEVINTSGKISDTKVTLENLSMIMDAQSFEMNGSVENLESPVWQLMAKGGLDLEKIMTLYPMDGIDIKGKVSTNIESSGNMRDLETKRYRNLSTKGEVSISDFVYEDESMPQSYEIKAAKTSFTTQSINIENFSGSAGETNYSVKGSITNYLGFILNDENLKGNVSATADRLNINEWMTSEEITEDTGESAPLEVIRLPRNAELVLDSKINEVVYNSLTMSNISGKFIVKDGVLDLNKARFDALQGSVTLNGKYDSRPEKPSFDFGFDVSSVSIPSAFQSISMIQTMAPVTENMTGSFNTDFSISGLLNQDMMPDYSSVTGKGVIQVLKASLGQSGIISELGSVSKLANISSATLDKVNMTAEIKQGRLFVKPFNLKLGSYTTTIAGSTGIDGSLDYVVSMDVPAGQMGTRLNSLISTVTNTGDLIGSDLKLDLGLKGTYSDPKVGLSGVRNSDGASVGSAVTASIQSKINEKKDDVKEEVDAKIEDAKDSASRVVDSKVEELKDSVSTTVNSKIDSAASKLTDKLGIPKDSLPKELKETKKKAEDVLKGLFKKKKKKKGDGKGGSSK